ncbi:MAG: two-component hybrid sensor and regulator [Deltaproteobacteria bacterium]|jgi:signal-transduction protein with cAMP-binding, CBS, and nucleotidyltransferase domain|nr:two-component hybrid sensor and regulator [Deltaproteobacteria bacterium]
MLSNQVKEIMTTQLTSARITETISRVVEIMVTADIGRVIITDADVPVGIFTEKDVLKRVANKGTDLQQTSIREVMTSPIQAVAEETHILEALGRMYQGNFRHLLVRGRRGTIVGIVSMRRILKIAVELGQGLSETRTVGEIMSGQVLTVDEERSISESTELMMNKNSSAVVVTQEQRTKGIFTERDLLKRVINKVPDITKTPVREVMTAPLISMPRTTHIGDVLAEMYRRDIRNMPVKGDREELLGIVSMPDVLRYARAFNIDENVRQSWKEVANFWQSDDHYTPG